MKSVFKIGWLFIPLGLYQLESIIIIIDALISCTCNSKKLYLKCILKHVVIQYYVMKSKNLLSIIDLNNIHGFNILRYILWILSKKIASVFNCHILPCLCSR